MWVETLEMTSIKQISEASMTEPEAESASEQVSWVCRYHLEANRRRGYIYQRCWEYVNGTAMFYHVKHFLGRVRFKVYWMRIRGIDVHIICTNPPNKFNGRYSRY